MPEKDVSGRWGRSLVGAAALVVWLGLPGKAHAEEPPGEGAAKAPQKTAIDVSALMGGAVRLGEAPLFDVASRGGVNLGLGFAYLMHPISLGLAVEHVGLGREESGVGPFGAVSIERAVDTVWASVRVRFSGPRFLVPMFGVGLGATWQTARATGVFLFDGGLSGGRAFGCSVTDSLNIAFRANAAAEMPMSSAVSLVLEGSFDAYRLSSDVIETCAPGAGTTAALLIRAALVYRFDLTEASDRKPPTSAAQVR
jgi:hypothetical protein